MKKILLMAVIFTLHVSCSSTKNSMEVSVGENKSKLIKTYGSPVRTLADNENGEILVYADQVFLNEDNSNGPRIAGQNYWDYNYVYVNKDGKVTSTRKEKQNYPPQAIDSQKIQGMNLLTAK